MDKEGGIGTYCSPNESPDRVKEEESGQVIGQNPKAEVAPFSSAEIGKKKSFFQDRGRHERTGIWCQTPGKEAEPGFRTAVGVVRCFDTVAKIPGKSGKNLGQEDNRCLQVKLYKIPLPRKRENTPRKNPLKS